MFHCAAIRYGCLFNWTTYIFAEKETEREHRFMAKLNGIPKCCTTQLNSYRSMWCGVLYFCQQVARGSFFLPHNRDFVHVGSNLFLYKILSSSPFHGPQKKYAQSTVLGMLKQKNIKYINMSGRLHTKLSPSLWNWYTAVYDLYDSFLHHRR